MEPKLITYKGETKTVSQWAKETNLNPTAIHRRLERGWDIKRIFETPSAINLGAERITKSDAERFLNDLSVDNIPLVFINLVKDRIKNQFKPVSSHGTWIRINHKNLFDKWYLEDYAPAQ